MMDKGIDTATIKVERQLPRNRKIMMLVSAAAIMASTATPLMAARTNSDWSLIGCTVKLGGRVAFMPSSFSRMPSTIDSVEVDPFFSTDINTERLPLT